MGISVQLSDVVVFCCSRFWIICVVLIRNKLNSVQWTCMRWLLIIIQSEAIKFTNCFNQEQPSNIVWTTDITYVWLWVVFTSNNIWFDCNGLASTLDVRRMSQLNDIQLISYLTNTSSSRTNGQWCWRQWLAIEATRAEETLFSCYCTDLLRSFVHLHDHFECRCRSIECIRRGLRVVVTCYSLPRNKNSYR